MTGSGSNIFPNGVPPWLAKKLVEDSLVKKLAKDVLTMAANGGMPDTFWQTDSRIARACGVLRWTPEDARAWARRQASV